MAKSELDIKMFQKINEGKKAETPIQQVVRPVKDKGKAKKAGIFVRIPEDYKKAFKHLAVDREITQEALMADVLAFYFSKNNLPLK